jgi:spore maturation protein CgeB
MALMRILYLGKDYSSSLASSWFYLMREMSHLHTIIRCGTPANRLEPLTGFLRKNLPPEIAEVATRLRIPLEAFQRSHLTKDVEDLVQVCGPDVILVDSHFPPVATWRNLEAIAVPKAMVISDPHHMLRQKLMYAQEKRVDTVFIDYLITTKTTIFKKWRMKNKIPVRWLPHSVNTDVFRSYGPDRKYDVISAGNIDRTTYPLRNYLREIFRKQEDLVFAMPRHPLQDLREGRDFNRLLIRERYARFLADSKLFAFGSSIYNYPLMKYFEGMACETLVVAPLPNDAEQLGFAAGENVVRIDAKNCVDQVRYFLRNEEERREMTENGRKLMNERHSSRIRAQQLSGYLEEISKE